MKNSLLYIYFTQIIGMLNPQVQIELKQLCLYLVNLISTSCQLLHQFSEDSQLSWKGKDNPVTEVDYLIQHFIVSRLKDRYGQHCLNIVAEEDLTYKTCPQFKDRVVKKVQEIKVSETVASFPKVVEFEGLYEAKQLCIWIDPLDCTQGFINQRKHQVTILIGVSYNGTPICGMIGHPYKFSETGNALHKKPAAYLPSVYFGSSELKLNHAFQYKISEQAWQVKEGTGNDEQQQLNAISKITAIGYRKMSARQQKVVKELGLKVIRAGGAGYKCLKVINKEVGSLMFIDAKTSKWDTCAGEAIIRSMGGFTATQNLEQIEYCPDKSSQNSSGFVFSLFKDLPAAVSGLVS